MNHDHSLLMIIQVKKLEHTDEILRAYTADTAVQFSFLCFI